MRLVPRWLIVGVFSAVLGVCAPGILVDDYTFTNQAYTWDQFIGVFSNFPGCRLTYSELAHIFRCCRVHGVHPVVVLAKLQQESDIVINAGGSNRYAWRLERAMGYGMILSWREPTSVPAGNVKLYKYGGYYIQLWEGTRRLRELFDLAELGPRELADGTPVTVSNRASSALYSYTPFYGLHTTHGYESRGNELFTRYYSAFYVMFYK